MSDEEILQSMRETFRVRPDASPMEAVVEADADPDRWLDAAETLAEGGEPELPPEAEGAGAQDCEHDDGAAPAEMPEYDGPWGAVDWTAPESGVYPDALLAREQWMARDGKLPFAPWGDRDAPAECNSSDCPADRADEARCECDARRKWGFEEFYRDGETVAMAEADAKIDGRAFIQRERDPFSFVDGDDVRDPETGAVHPAFVDILNEFGLTYADVSTSGSGVHANYEGELPNDIPEAKWVLDDEPWGSNDDLPAIEVYSNTHVCVTTGERLPGSAEDVREWDADAVRDVLDEAGELRQTTTDRADFEAEDYEPEVTDADETTDEIRDIYHALDRLNAQRVAEDTIVAEWLEGRTEHRCFRPTWASPDYDGTAVYCDDDKFVDTGQRGGYGGPAAMAAIDAGLVSDTDCPRAVSGETWFKALAHLRELGYDIPEFVGDKSEPDHDIVDSERDTDPAAEAEAVAGGAEPAETDGGAVTAGADGDSGPETSFEAFADRVRDAITVYDAGDIKKATARQRITDALMDEFDFVYPEEEVFGWAHRLYVYEPSEGIYEPRGVDFIERQLERAGGDFVTNNLVREIVGKVERRSKKRDEAFNTAPERLVVDNGILDLHTGELDPHSALEYHRSKIDVAWNPDAGEPDAIDEFFHDIVDDSDVDTLYRLVAHTLYKDYIGNKAAMLIGSGANGKSMFLSLIEELLGEFNVTRRELHDFSGDDFALNNLAGKLANLATEIGDKEMNDTTAFKKATGGDNITAQVKHESPIDFKNYATMMFATNEMPVFAQDNHAIWRRWLYVEFPYTFDADDPDAKDPVPERVLERRLFRDEELQALLVRCQQEIERWWNGEPLFADAMPAEDVRAKMKQAAEPVFAFANACLEAADEDEWVEKSVVREAYKAFASEEDLPRIPDNEFGSRLLSLRDYQIEAENGKRHQGDRYNVYSGIQLSSRGRQVLGVDEPGDEQGTVDGEYEQATAAVLDHIHELVNDSGGEPVPAEAIVWSVPGLGKAEAASALEELKSSGRVYDSGDGILPT